VISLDEPAPEERIVVTFRKQAVALYADRISQQWIVRDPEGNFWIVPCVENGWEYRLPFHLNEDTTLEPVPGHYKEMFGLPF
jgi:hypothetical protein